jgi:hypothetical protein
VGGSIQKLAKLIPSPEKGTTAGRERREEVSDRNPVGSYGISTGTPGQLRNN